MRPVNLPAGLEDKGVEVYLHKGELRVIFDSKVIPFSLLPGEIRDVFLSHMMQNKAALSCLKNDFKLTDAGEMLEQYVKCNFGNFDGQADMSEDGIIIAECWDCGLRGSCPGEGRICSRLTGDNGILTKRETEIFFLIIEGKLDKEIANHFGSSLATVETQLKDIRTKLGCNNKVEIMNFAMKRRLLIL